VLLQKLHFNINPYQEGGLWFFDEPKLGLYKEGLTDGTPEVLSQAITLSKLNQPISVLFSDVPIFEHSLVLLGPFKTGHQYYWTQQNMVCWFCPALLRFFKKPPSRIWFRIKEKSVLLFV
jgi:hypothetical protein